MQPLWHNKGVVGVRGRQRRPPCPAKARPKVSRRVQQPSAQQRAWVVRASFAVLQWALLCKAAAQAPPRGSLAAVLAVVPKRIRERILRGWSSLGLAQGAGCG